MHRLLSWPFGLSDLGTQALMRQGINPLLMQHPRNLFGFSVVTEGKGGTNEIRIDVCVCVGCSLG